MDVYPNRVTESRRKRDASRLWGFESLGVHPGEVLSPRLGKWRNWERAGIGSRRSQVRVLSSLLVVG
jgi:hypothetical protein